ncbi:hypothetical protein EUTSA_v10015649mg [Eutrema salsugineum]|uniref:RRM domain-containing protein n=2 Tax=Eutrema salsugineum TaxID=72664 RepID=V4LBM8_EUTSA|nr:hypothetical protein EUTSA_v10015649mg [Eutrema salsugineum]
MSSPTIEQLHAFHAQDREIFSKLVIKFSRPPAESLLVMATWFWLEDFGFENIFSIIMALPDPLIAAFANEAVLCFRCLDSSEPPNGLNRIPLTVRFMKKDISLLMIYKHRYTAIAGIKNFLNTVCSRIFSDILQQVLPPSSSSVSSSFVTRLRYPLNIPGFPDQTFGSINVMSDVFGRDYFSDNNLFLFPDGLWRWNASCVATENDRTMFITFSRGFPVSQAEVKALFTERFGENCVVGVYMPENASSTNVNSEVMQQSLFAKLVLDSVVTVDRILQGGKLRKFRINGKHIWARKYNEKRDGPNGRTCLIN